MSKIKNNFETILIERSSELTLVINLNTMSHGKI